MSPPFRSAAEVARADLPDDVAAFPVVVGDAPFAGVLHRPREGHAPVDGLDRGVAQGAVAHRRRVHEARRPERVAASARPAEDLCGGKRVAGVVPLLARDGRVERERGVSDDDVSRFLLEVVVRPEPEVAVLLLRRRVDPAALVAAEGAFLVVPRDDVLPERPSERLEPVPEAAEDREVRDDRVRLLDAVVDRDRDENEEHGAENDESRHGSPLARRPTRSISGLARGGEASTATGSQRKVRDARVTADTPRRPVASSVRRTGPL